MRMYTNPQDPLWDKGDSSPGAAPGPQGTGPEGTAALPPDAGAPPSLWDQALGVIAEGVFMADLSQPHCPMIEVSPAFERLTGYTAAELLGQPYDMWRGAEGDPAVFAEVGAALRAGRAWSGEVRTTRKDGTAVRQELRLTPVADAAGQVRYALGVLADVGERRELEEALQQAQKMAAVGWLAGGLAHDFNNVLTPILGFCDLLLGGSLPAPVRLGLGEIRKAGALGTTLIEQLMGLCRKQPPQPRVQDLATVAANVAGLLHCLLPKNVEMLTSAAPDLGRILAPPGQVEQVLLNLVRNACDAMPQGGTVHITLANADRAAGPDATGIPPGRYAVLAVSDTGVGMSAEVRAGLFRPLVTTKDLGKGSGLGLFVVHGIVRQNHGFITVASEPGQGTRVEIYWPRVADTEPAAPDRRGPATILLVDDEPAVRDLMGRILRQQGYRVLEAGNGPEAVTVGREHAGPIDLLLTDVRMPGMNAHELVAVLAPLRPDMKVVYLSGDTPEGQCDFLPKPFSPDALVRKVREVLGEPPSS